MKQIFDLIWFPLSFLIGKGFTEDDVWHVVPPNLQKYIWMPQLFFLPQANLVKSNALENV